MTKFKIVEKSRFLKDEAMDNILGMGGITEICTGGMTFKSCTASHEICAPQEAGSYMSGTCPIGQLKYTQCGGTGYVYEFCTNWLGDKQSLCGGTRVFTTP